MKNRLLLSMLIVTVLSSCSKKGGSSSPPPAPSSETPATNVPEESTNSPRVESREEVKDDAGIYRAILKPLNNEAAGKKTGGTSVIKIKDDELNVKIFIIRAPSHTSHKQMIYSGSKCPDATSDLNNDKIIDKSELENVVENVFLSLDGDINELKLGEEEVPKSNGDGDYEYEEQGSVASLKKELNLTSLALNSKTLVIFGLKRGTVLPPTVTPNDMESTEATIPIACGEIVRIENE